MTGIVVFAYGNPSRGDDALGPEFLRLLEEGMARHPQWRNIELLTDFQLQIEHAVDLENRDLALFVDASLSCPAPYQFTCLQPVEDKSYTSHAMSPAAILHVYQQIHQRAPPPAFLLSIRGDEFGLGQPMAEAARKNLAAAYEFVKTLLAQPSQEHWRDRASEAL